MHLIARDVAIEYGDRVVVDGFSGEFATGSVTALVGPSGVGKSSLLSVLGGVLAPTRGTVEVRNIHGELAELNAAWISQKPVVFAGRSVCDNVAVGARARGLRGSQLRDRVDGAITAVGLERVRNHVAGTLSGGELQRLTVARADAYDAPFVFADEPTGSLDSDTSLRVGRVLIDTAIAGERCVVVATHDLKLAEVCTTVIDMSSLP